MFYVRLTVSIVNQIILHTGNVQVSGDSVDTMFSDEESLEVIVPRPDGPGKCTYSLVEYLVQVHNEFIETCMATVKQRYWYQNGVRHVFIEIFIFGLLAMF